MQPSWFKTSKARLLAVSASCRFLEVQSTHGAYPAEWASSRVRVRGALQFRRSSVYNIKNTRHETLQTLIDYQSNLFAIFLLCISPS